MISRVVRCTIRRSIRREVLWNGNVEPPLWSLLTDAITSCEPHGEAIPATLPVSRMFMRPDPICR